MKQNLIKFEFAGCDISFNVMAPADITLEQLLKQCDKIKPDWCACGIHTADFSNESVDLIIDYNSVNKTNKDASCSITDKKWF